MKAGSTSAGTGTDLRVRFVPRTSLFFLSPLPSSCRTVETIYRLRCPLFTLGTCNRAEKEACNSPQALTYVLLPLARSPSSSYRRLLPSLLKRALGLPPPPLQWTTDPQQHRGQPCRTEYGREDGEDEPTAADLDGGEDSTGNHGTLRRVE
jgi:hypothetical protein